MHATVRPSVIMSPLPMETSRRYVLTVSQPNRSLPRTEIAIRTTMMRITAAANHRPG